MQRRLKMFCRKCKVYFFTKETNINAKHSCGEYGLVDWNHGEREEGNGEG